MSNPPPYDPNQPQYGSTPPPYDPNQPPQYGSPQPAPQWQAPGAPGYSQPGTFDPQAGAYAPQAGAFDPQSGAHRPQSNAFDPQTGRYGPPAKKSGAGLWIAIGAVVLLLVCVLCGGLGWWVYSQSPDAIDSPPTSTTSSKPPAGAHTVVYRVTGTGQAAVTWSEAGPGGGVDQETVTLPWSVELSSDRESIGLTVIAVARSDDAKLEKCVISVDGRELNSVEASGTQRTLTCFAFFME
jgi:hypothetical protein